MMKPADLGDHLTFTIAPPGNNFNLSNTLIYNPVPANDIPLRCASYLVIENEQSMYDTCRNVYVIGMKHTKVNKTMWFAKTYNANIYSDWDIDWGAENVAVTK